MKLAFAGFLGLLLGIANWCFNIPIYVWLPVAGLLGWYSARIYDYLFGGGQ